MSLVLKVLAALVALVVLVVGGLALYLFTIFDPNDYKTEIQALVERQTELKLDIKGDLQLSVFPWLGVSVEDISIARDKESLASAGYARVFAKFMPLLKGELEVDGVALRDLKLNLVKDAKGQANWDISTTPKSTGSKADAVASSPASLPLAAFAFGYLKVENAEITYRDLGTNSFHQLQDLDFQVSNVSANSRFPVSADFAYFNQQLSTPVQAHFTAQVTLNLPEERLTLTDAILDLDDARLRTDIKLEQLQQNPVLSGHIKVSELVPANWAERLDFDALAKLRSRFALQSNLLLDIGNDTLALDELTLSSPELQLTGNLSATNLTDALNYTGRLSLDKANLRTLLPQLGIELPKGADKQTLTNLSGLLAFEGSAQQLNVPQITLQLDDSKLDGSIKVSAFSPSATRFDLQIDRLDLDRYLPAADHSNSAPTQSSQPTAGEALLLPLAALRELNTSGRLRIGHLKASGYQVDNLDASVTANNGFINLKNLTGNLYEGSVKVSANIDARSYTPQISLNQAMTGIQAAPLLATLADIDYLEGKLNLNINATARGNSIEQIKNSLSGTANFSLIDGVLKNTNIEQLVCKSIARIRERPFVAENEGPDTPFQRFEGRMNIVNGLMQSEGLQLALKTLKVTGDGLINLPEESLDYRIRATLVGDLDNQSCEVHERYRNVAWPIRCQGSFTDDPAKMCGLDQRELQNIAAQLAQQEIKRKASDEIDKKLKDKLGDEAAQQLKDLFGL